VKTFFDNSTPTTSTSTKSSTESLDYPLTAINNIAEREMRENLRTTVKAKLERLRSTTLTRHDQAVGLLDM
jgi:hypothetical protein